MKRNVHSQTSERFLFTKRKLLMHGWESSHHIWKHFMRLSCVKNSVGIFCGDLMDSTSCIKCYSCLEGKKKSTPTKQLCWWSGRIRAASDWSDLFCLSLWFPSWGGWVGGRMGGWVGDRGSYHYWSPILGCLKGWDGMGSKVCFQGDDFYEVISSDALCRLPASLTTMSLLRSHQWQQHPDQSPHLHFIGFNIHLNLSALQNHFILCTCCGSAANSFLNRCPLTTSTSAYNSGENDGIVQTDYAAIPSS